MDPQDIQYEDVLDMLEAYGVEGLLHEIIESDPRLQAAVIHDMHNLGMVDLGAFVEDDNG
tara:strand:+ start:1089 stop:1268 length:180 start_codon:yes stop_codon:yes gene_type:complete